MPIKVVNQYLKTSSFNLAQEPQVLIELKSKPDIEIAIDIDAKKLAAELFEISLKISTDAKLEGEPLFSCEVIYAGLFHLSEIPEESFEEVLLIYCPSLLFPFVRRIISNITSDAGFAPLMLTPVDFADLYIKRKKAQEASVTSDRKN